MYRKKDKGLTLIELLCTILIAGILVAFSIPSYQNMVDRSRLSAELSQWRQSFQFAQAEAMKDQKAVYLCPSSDGSSCSEKNFSNYSIGWIVIKDNGTIVRDYAPTMDTDVITLSKANGKLTLLPDGRVSGIAEPFALSVTNQDKSQSVSLTISLTGRIL